MPNGTEDNKDREKKEPRFLVVEGPDGSDRNDQLRLLEGKFPSCKLIQNPLGGIFDELVAELPEWADKKPTYDLFPFFRARVGHLKKTIEPMLEEGFDVIAGPYVASAYASLIRGDERRELEPAFLSVCASLPRALTPGAYFVLDPQPGTAHSRMKERAVEALARGGAEVEVKPLKHFERVREGFLKFGNLVPKPESWPGSRYALIKPGKDRRDTHESLFHEIERFLQA